VNADKYVAQVSAKCCALCFLGLLVFSQVGCAWLCPPSSPPQTKVDSIYVPVAGERLEWDHSNVKVVVQMTSTSDGDERQAAVSPNGKYVAFVSRPAVRKAGEQVTNDVYVVDAEDGGNRRQITNTEGDQATYYPYWWMGNERLLYARYDGSPYNTRGLYWQDFPPKQMEGYAILRRENQFWVGDARIWSGFPSPDGKRIAVCMETPESRKTRIVRPDVFRRQPQLENPQIIIYNVETKLADYFAAGTDPAWSPDGKNIAFAQARGDNSFIMVKNVETKEQRQITDGTDCMDWMPCWSPSGSAIAFASWRDRDWNIYKVDVNGKGLIKLTTSKGTEWDPTWGPGGYIFFSFLRKGKGQDWDIWRLQLQPK
jgi:Tol biopolymer transport system component